MATSRSYMARINYRFLSNDREQFNSMPIAPETAFELHESEVWNETELDPSEFRKHQRPSSRKKASSSAKNRVAEEDAAAGGTPLSVPMNIPDWSKILRDEYKENRRRNFDDDDDEEYRDSASCVPPHEFLARTRIASLSVHEGIGRTLKGRDLSRVRNAIWEKTGFQD
ncbi:hypothetical protein Nepgr_014370 [Nepenthes gracilis]|uniref:Senescence regulator n=1 Tax=Nepenthes gracilis TaxID=150966 RepID=A0AAD3SKR1_NEPGR|nr:hypothetical protein Nepgr_014370 [Nepenthes gracilis]